LNFPSAVSVDPFGNLVVTDTGNRRILIVTPDGAIVGVVNIGLNSPVYAVADRSGNVYIADAGLGRILKAIPGRVPMVLLDGVASPRGLALDSEGNLYFTETDAGRVHRLSTTGEVTTFGDGTWSVPRGVAVDAAGNVFVADTGLQRILRIDRDGTVTPVAGNGTPGFSGDGGAALSAQLGFPWDVAIAVDGTLLIADLDSNRIRRLTPSAVAPPAIRAIEVLNAASLQPGPIAPGMLVALRGTGLNSTEGVEVLFDQIAASILTASATQLVIQTPAAIAAKQSVQIDVRSAGISLGVITVNVAPAAPALFADSTGQAAATNAGSG
jgi:glucose/arabinose dehydrogenase